MSSRPLRETLGDRLHAKRSRELIPLPELSLGPEITRSGPPPDVALQRIGASLSLAPSLLSVW